MKKNLFKLKHDFWKKKVIKREYTFNNSWGATAITSGTTWLVWKLFAMVDMARVINPRRITDAPEVSYENK